MAKPVDPRAGYNAIDDPYCYKGTSVLKNIPGIRDPADLAAFETVSVTQRSDEPLPDGQLSVRHYCAIHRHLFQDVYRWAGRIRRIRTSKADSMFCYPENIGAEMRKLFSDLRRRHQFRGLASDAFAAHAAHFLSELNAIHPFREGNGRSQMALMTLIAARAGHPFDLERLNPKAFMNAMIHSFGGNETPLQDRLRTLLR